MAAEDELSPFKYSQNSSPGRVLISTIMKNGSGKEFIGKSVSVGAWVRSGRLAEKDSLAFLSLSDGTCAEVVQAVVRSEVYSDLKSLVLTGSSVLLKGQIIKSPKEEQDIELQVQEILYHSPADGKEYPLAKKSHTMLHLRANSHLRSRTNLMSSVFRVRNTLAKATHLFFQSRGFFYIHTPIITASDCEGAGEMLQVTNLLPGKKEKIEPLGGATPQNVDELKKKVGEIGGEIKKLKEEKASADEIKDKVEQLKSSKTELAKLTETGVLYGSLPVKEQEGVVDYGKDFFKVPSYLTVSGQLQVEAFTCSMSNTYTFGPTFRAEDSNTTRHLAEFWMIEPEIAFADLHDDINLAEDYVRFCCECVMKENKGDLEAIDKYNAFARKEAEKAAKRAPKKKGEKKVDESKNAAFQGKRISEEPSVTRVQNIIDNPFQRISYTEGIDLLLKAVESGVEFKHEVFWGVDLASEHERYLAEVVFKKPTVIYNYPKEIKAFYMRVNDDGKTVAAMDIVCPQIGELIGGSQREERLDKLLEFAAEREMDLTEMEWYLDLRRYGSVPHSGFGLGFERLILFLTGMENIRDVVPFPRPPGGPL